MTGKEQLLTASIVIPVHNRCEDVLECIGAVLPQAEEHGAEIIVIDDASADNTAARVRREFPGIRLLENPEQQGPARSRNIASRAARGRLFCYLDSDGAAGPGWLAALLAVDDGATVLLGCVVDYEGGRVQGVPRRTTFLGKSLRCHPRRANTGPSCNLAIPAACFDAVGGYDEELPYYFEDSDLCIRARRAGYGFRYVPDAVFRHKGSEKKQGDAIRLQENNSTYAMLKHYHGSPVRRLAFSLLNGFWLLLRGTAWFCTCRFADARRLCRGWREAYRRYGEYKRRETVT
jgi:GT2 family glycosyltransferase